MNAQRIITPNALVFKGHLYGHIFFFFFSNRWNLNLLNTNQVLTFLLLKKPTRFGGSIKALAQALCNGHTIHIYLEELLVSVRLTDQIFQISTSDKSQHHDGHDYPRKEETESNPTGKTNKQEKKKLILQAVIHSFQNLLILPIPRIKRPRTSAFGRLTPVQPTQGCRQMQGAP